ncbi:galactokinase [Elasticomyces elasticus]|nr:galactokinase [Elasticomyces elasticus]KAK5008999.1 hypothetical protein LTR28_003220 [Elasticomyces elasticus]
MAEVPIVKFLEDIYPEDALSQQNVRWDNLLRIFKERYGRPAEFVSRSPGRVNIIGEHIDYSLYEVIPMAVTADVLIAFSPSSSPSSPIKIRLSNTDSKKFTSGEIEMPKSGGVEIDVSSHEWTNYFKAGLKGATGLLKRKRGQNFASCGMDVLVDGTVPSGGGLSSSAAFVCASALAILKANGEQVVDKKELVELAVVSERAVGVNSGGMDQAASVFSLRGSALFVSFVPELSARALTFPKTKTPLTFVIAQSFVTSEKKITGPVCYNLRVVECTLAALVLSKIFSLRDGLAADHGPLGVSLRGFQNAYYEQEDGVDPSSLSTEDFQKQLEKLVHMVDDYLPQEEGYDREQISELLGMPIEEIEEKYMTKFPVRAELFKLRQRALHVYTEAIRVLKFTKLLDSSEPKSDEESEKLLQDLGALMNSTQDSCRDVYECSCPELDELCQLARGAGAYGSRLTGAGWGGCSVHLVPQDKVEAVKKAWNENYYSKRMGKNDPRLSEAVVVSKPGSGSCLFLVEGRESVT